MKNKLSFIALALTIALSSALAKDEHHPAKLVAPNGGRIVEVGEQRLEFLEKADGHAQITFLNDQGQTLPPANQTITLVGGDRSKPTHLTFAKSGNVLVSDKALPSSSNPPILLQIKTTPDSKAIIEKFNLNRSTCPECSLKEYACSCGH